MNTTESFLNTPFQDRDLSVAIKPATSKPARFASEINDGDGLEVVLRCLLLVCLLSAGLICSVRLGGLPSQRARSIYFQPDAVRVAAAPVAAPVVCSL